MPQNRTAESHNEQSDYSKLCDAIMSPTLTKDQPAESLTDHLTYAEGDGTIFVFIKADHINHQWECWDRNCFIANIYHNGNGEYSIQVRDDLDSKSFHLPIKEAFIKYAVKRAAAVDLN